MDTTVLPLNRVVLFSSGVGFFDHAGVVKDNARVELKFNVGDINDLLKSMVVQDLGGGQVSTVSYDSRDPIAKTLKTFAIDLTTDPTLAQLLGQVRGQRIEVNAEEKITGVILGVERRKHKVNKDELLEVDVLNLLTDDGLKSVSLDTVSRIRLLNEQLDAELRLALDLLATPRSLDRKTVTLNFLGEGERPVRLGYVQETPIWKTSYRLMLEEDQPPFLQGWAIVENTTEADWKDVSLTLVSGRPISFIMDLYQPLYRRRPIIELKQHGSLRLQAGDGDLTSEKPEFRTPAPAKAKRMANAEPEATSGFAGTRDDDTAASGVAEPQRSDHRQDGELVGDVGELFQYAIATPISLSRQQSAMLPIFNSRVEGEKVSIYNQNVHPRYPRYGLKLTNSTELHLMQGPITIFDQGVYAGDARIDDLSPGAERLISFALDPDVEVTAKFPESQVLPEEILSVHLFHGTLRVTQKQGRRQQYTVKNSGARKKRVLLEHPCDPAWTLVDSIEPTERTPDSYRFAVELEPGESKQLIVEQQRTSSQQTALADLEGQTVQEYLNDAAVSKQVKNALSEIIERKRELSDLSYQQKRLQRRVNAITEQQDGIRQSISHVDQKSDFYKHYVKKFNDQLEKLHEQIQELTEQEADRRKTLDEHLASIDLQ